MTNDGDIIHQTYVGIYVYLLQPGSTSTGNT
jgi:hypothetical protein